MRRFYPHGKKLVSPGGAFYYEVQGPVCILYDREQLPWPCCSLAWKGKQPSWNRIGRRLVPDMAASRCHAYAVKAWDVWGDTWEQVLTLYYDKLEPDVRRAWYSKIPLGHHYPDFHEEA